MAPTAQKFFIRNTEEYRFIIYLHNIKSCHLVHYRPFPQECDLIAYFGFFPIIPSLHIINQTVCNQRITLLFVLL